MTAGMTVAGMIVVASAPDPVLGSPTMPDPATITDPSLRAEAWDWLDAVVCWFNAEYVWDPTLGVIPACWPRHPHLVHEIAVIARPGSFARSLS